MNQVKRKLHSNQSDDKGIKKLQCKVNIDQEISSITSIENLSNELFHAIFDYLDGYHISKAFYNLNDRFQQLLNSSYLLFKIKVDRSSNELHTSISEHISYLNMDQIFSLHILSSVYIDNIFSTFLIDSSFSRLESLTLPHRDVNVLMSVLFGLTCLPRLFSLTIRMFYTKEGLGDIYRLIFALPKLKYIKCSADHSDITVSLPIATHKQLSTIEHLVIDHPWRFNELSAIVSYMPQLRHLNVVHTDDNDQRLGSIVPIRLSSLTYISIHMCCVIFDDLEMFITKLDCKLKVLRVIVYSEYMDFLDADRWERLILQYCPQLEKFYLQSCFIYNDEGERPVHFGKPDQFTSSFWIKRKWVFEVKINCWPVECSISSFRKRWYDINSSTELSKSTRIIITSMPTSGCGNILTTITRLMLPVIQNYHLEIFSERKIFPNVLIEIMDTIPKLDSLNIPSLSLSQLSCSSTEETTLRLLFSDKNEITKVCLQKIIDMEEVYFLMELCPRMIYLQVNCINNMDTELVLRDTLSKISNDCNRNLRSLCFPVPIADDKMMKQLEKMIDVEKLLVDYTIKRVLDKIYLQWR